MRITFSSSNYLKIKTRRTSGITRGGPVGDTTWYHLRYHVGRLTGTPRCALLAAALRQSSALARAQGEHIVARTLHVLGMAMKPSEESQLLQVVHGAKECLLGDHLAPANDAADRDGLERAALGGAQTDSCVPSQRRELSRLLRELSDSTHHPSWNPRVLAHAFVARFLS
jgi:hypothetical protein